MGGTGDEARLEDVAARLRNVNADPSLEITVKRRWHGLLVASGGRCK